MRQFAKRILRSDAMSVSMFTTANLLIGTGTIHCGFGFLIPELRDPLFRSIWDVAIVVPDTNERSARRCCFWYQVAGVMMTMLGCYIRSNGATEPPKWFGRTLCAMGLVGGILMPISGFWFILFQGTRLLWTHEKVKIQK